MEAPQDNETMPLKDGFNFTPMFNGQRVRMRALGLNPEGQAFLANSRQVRASGVLGIVRDTDTHIAWVVKSRECSLDGCYCDAEIILWVAPCAWCI